MWVSEFDKANKGVGATYMVNFSNLHTIITAWRKHVAERKIVQEFRKLWGIRRLKTLAIRGF